MSRVGVVLALLLSWAAEAAAQAPATTAAEQPLRIVITGVEGNVQYRATTDEPWQLPAAGLELAEGVEFRTGPKSAVRFVIPPDQTVTLDRLGTVKVLRANLKDGKIVTDLGMKYGRTRYDIETAEREHDSRVRTPATVLTIRGTKVSVYDQPPFAPQAVSLTGRAMFRDIKKQVAFGGVGKAVVQADEDSPAELSLSQSYVDPSVADARTPAESRLLESLLAQGGALSYDAVNNIPVIRGGTPPTIAQVVASPPGALNFILRWTGNTDLNLTIAPIGLNEIVTPVYPLNRSASGGRTLFDHRGGANGGLEVVFWPGGFPGYLPGTADDVTYVNSIDFISGDPTPVDLTTVIDGQIISRQVGTVSSSGSNVQFVPGAGAQRPQRRRR